MKTRIVVDQRPVQDGRQLVRVLLHLAGSPPDHGARTPLNLALVLDRSGSMSGEKLAAARTAARQLVRGLWPEDLVSVVAYDDEVLTVAAPAAGEAAATVSARIAGIEVGGNTNLSGGWLRGRELTAAGAHPGRFNRILLLTDGLANVGITDAATLAGLCAGARAQGIRTTTIGFGEDYDEQLLRRMAEAGGGAMYYIERADQAALIFREELNDLLATTAQNVSVTIEAAPDVELACVHHAYPSHAHGGTLRLDVGDLYVREPRTLLAEFLVVGGPADGSTPVARFVVRGEVIRGADVRTETVTLPVAITRSGAAVVDPEIERERLIVEAAAAREAALEERRSGDPEAAAERLRALAARIKASALDDAQLREEAADLEVAAASFEGPPAPHFAAEAKYHYQRAYESLRGRSKRAGLIARRPPEA